MKIGLVCPYSFDAPGGVQAHVRDLAEELRERGHNVSVLAPGTAQNEPEWIELTGRSFPIKFNGSTARLSFGFGSFKKTKQWLEAGNFDVVHVHEPGTPSLGMIALQQAEVPVVATFHSAMSKSKLRAATSAFVQPLLERISARIAVSQEAKRTLEEHHGGQAVIIPNGVATRTFKDARSQEKWRGTKKSPSIVFLGRVNEPRKGLPVFLGAVSEVLSEFPQARFIIAGRGESSLLEKMKETYPQNIRVLGEITEQAKRELLKSATIYVAPQTGGESFGIVLVEAMAAGTAVVAADIKAFRAVLGDGKFGKLFPVGSSTDLAKDILELLSEPTKREALAKAGYDRSSIYDWSQVADQIHAVYDVVTTPGESQRSGTLYEKLRESLSRWRGLGR